MKTYTQSQIKEKKLQRRRLVASTFLTVIIHILVFLLLVFLLPEKVFEQQEEFTGPLYVELADFPEVVPEIEETVEPTFTKREEIPVSEETPSSNNSTDTKPLPENSNTETPGTDREEVISPVENPEDTISEQKPQAEPVKEPDNDFSEDTSQEKEPEQSTLDLSELDRMLETEPDNTASPVDDTSPSDSDFSLTWEDAMNREAVSLANPVIPDWVSRQGLNLRVVISFTLVPQGFLINITLKESCGYTDVDTAVINAVRNWKFKAVNSTVNVRGSVTYHIRAR